MRRLRIRRWVRILLVGCLVLFIYIAVPGASSLTITEETCHITGPLDRYVYVDYSTALNTRMGQGIKSEHNANVLIWQAMGPHPEKATVPPRYFAMLGIVAPPEKGDYYRTWDDYFEVNLKRLPHCIFGLFAASSDWERYWKTQLDRCRLWPWRDDDYPEIAIWLKQNEKPLALITQASKRPQYFHPLVSRSSNPDDQRIQASSLPQIQATRELSQAFTARAMRSVADGNFRLAWEDLLVLQRLGRLVATGAAMIEHLIGVSIVANSSKAMTTLLGHARLNSTECLAYQSDLDKLPKIPSLHAHFDLGERYLVLDALTSIACHGVHGISTGAGPVIYSKPVPYAFWKSCFNRSIDWDQAFRNVNHTFNHLSAACDLPDRASRRREFEDIVDGVERACLGAQDFDFFDQFRMSKARRGELVAAIILKLLISRCDLMQNHLERATQDMDNLRVAIALATYRADRDCYPQRLEELAPKYLNSIPSDRFTGKPLHYEVTADGYLLYSIGVNELDEQGHDRDDNPRGDDLKIRVPLADPFAK